MTSAAPLILKTRAQQAEGYRVMDWDLIQVVLPEDLFQRRPDPHHKNECIPALLQGNRELSYRCISP